MKKSLFIKKKTQQPDELRSEYQLDYSKAKPNRFKGKMSKGGKVIVSAR